MMHAPVPPKPAAEQEFMVPMQFAHHFRQIGQHEQFYRDLIGALPDLSNTDAVLVTLQTARGRLRAMIDDIKQMESWLRASRDD
jgi:hypothetical protein